MLGVYFRVDNWQATLPIEVKISTSKKQQLNQFVKPSSPTTASPTGYNYTILNLKNSTRQIFYAYTVLSSNTYNKFLTIFKKT